MEQKLELKPCPFCGGEAKMTQIKSNGFMIKCDKCKIQRRQKVLRYPIEWLEEKMIEDWNTRKDTVIENNP